MSLPRQANLAPETTGCWRWTILPGNCPRPGVPGSNHELARTQRFQGLNLVRHREWWSLVPDYGHSFVTTGYGTLSPTTMDYVGATINPAGTLGMAYCPKEATIAAGAEG